MIEFDAAKDEANQLKHGFSLADAKALFDGHYLEMEDTRFDYPERRIISLRKANSREQAAYVSQIKS